MNRYTGMSSYKKPGRNGRRYRKQIGLRRYEKWFYGNKQECDAQFKLWCAWLENKLKDRPYDGSKTWDFFADAFLTHLRTLKDRRTNRPAYRPRTIDEYKQALQHFKTLAKPHYVNDITFADVAEFRRKIKTRADEKNTDFYSVNKNTACLIRAFEWGMAEGFVPVLNLDPLKKPFAVSKVVVSVLQPRQVALLLKYSSLKMRIAVKMGYYAGMRGEEVCNQLLNKIDPQNGSVWISENTADERLGIHYWMPKADKERVVFFPPDLLADIRQLAPAGPYLLTDRNGLPYTDKNFSNAFKQNLKTVNKEILRHEPDTAPIACTFKILRKTHLTQMLKAGAKEKEASLYAGHADTQVTEEHYLDPAVLKKQEQQEKIRHMEQVKKFVSKLPGTLKK